MESTAQDLIVVEIPEEEETPEEEEGDELTSFDEDEDEN